MKYKMSFWKRAKFFLKKNSYSLVVGVCALAVVSTIAITAAIKLNQTDAPIFYEETEDTVPVQASTPVVFVSPVAEYTLGTGYAEHFHVYNATLKEWGTHLGIDFVAPMGTAVVAVYDGVVESIGYTILEGTTITIKHEGNIKTIYKSLSSEVSVAQGQTVTQGQAIGSVSDSAANEAEMGAHLHFEVMKDDKYVDPLEFLSVTSK